MILMRNCMKIAPSSHRSYFNDFDKELYCKLPHNSQVSHFNDFDKELYRKLPRAAIGQISMILKRNCNGNCPSSQVSYFNDFDMNCKGNGP